MRDAGVGQVEHGVEFGGGQRNRRRVEPDIAVAVALNQSAGVAGIGLQVQQARGVGVQHRIIFAPVRKRASGWRFCHGRGAVGRGNRGGAAFAGTALAQVLGVVGAIA
jgi:hypothetical protein